eukprot:SAG11_NODE_8362_length_1024_cov_1.505946_1_plen_78_part_00
MQHYNVAREAAFRTDIVAATVEGFLVTERGWREKSRASTANENKGLHDGSTGAYCRSRQALAVALRGSTRKVARGSG